MTLAALGDGAEAGGPGRPHGGLDLMTAFRRQWRAGAIAAAALAAVTIALVWLLMKPTYTATGAIEIVPVIPRLVFQDESQQVPLYGNFVQTQAHIMVSNRVLYKMLEDEAVRNLEYIKGLDPARAVAEIQEQLSARAGGGSQLLQVSMSGRDPATAAAIANAVMRAYMILEGNKETLAEDDKLAALERERDQRRDTLKVLLAKKSELAKQFGTVDLSGREEIMLKRLQTLQEEQTRLETMRIAMEAQLRGVEARAGVEGQTARLELLRRDYVRADPLVQVLTGSIAQAEKDYALAVHARENELVGRLTALEQELDQAALAAERDLIARIEQLEKEFQEASLVPETDLSTRIAELERQEAQAASRWSDEMPEMKRLRAELAALRHQLKERQERTARREDETPVMQAKRRTLDGLRQDLALLREQGAQRFEGSANLVAIRHAMAPLKKELDELRTKTPDQVNLPQAESLRRTLATLRATLTAREETLKQRFKEEETKLLSAREQEDRQRELDGVRAQIAQLVAHGSRLRQLGDEQDSAARALGQTALAIKELQDDIALNNEVYDTLRKRVEQLEVERKRPARMRIAIEAEVPRTPSRDKRRQYSTVLFMGAMLFGAAFAVFLHRLQAKVETPVDAEVHGRLRVLGTTLRAEDLEGDRARPRQLMDDCQAIWVNLTLAAREQPARALVVTSPGAREGKTSFAIDLAASIAVTGRRVLLVDGDLWKPEVGRYIRLKTAVGLADVVSGACSAEDAVQTTPVKNLFVLPGVRRKGRHGEHLTDGVLDRTLARLRAAYEVIIIDTPPVLAMPDAALWGSVSDAVIFVARSGMTGTRDLSQANLRMQLVGARVLGAVVTGVRLRDSYNYYYHHYGPSQAEQPDEGAPEEDEAEETRPVSSVFRLVASGSADKDGTPAA